jgi:hypothetical protein
MTLLVKPAQSWKREAGWLAIGENAEWIEYMAVRRALSDSGIMEVPWASNRGTRLDEYTERSGSALGSSWCGVYVGAVFADVGAKVPDWYGAVDNWLHDAVPDPRPGSAVLYGPTPTNGEHMGVVTRTKVGRPGRVARFDNLTCEGNRGWAGSNTNNGIGVFHGLQTRDDVLGFVRPQPVPGWTITQYAPEWFLLEHWDVLPDREQAAAGEKIGEFLKAHQP